jgi:hypothetical protein
VAEPEKNLIDRPLLLNAERKAHMPKVQGDSSRRERNREAVFSTEGKG